MIEPTHVIKRPLVTEKSTWESHSRNRYSFLVDLAATKDQIRASIEKLYNVRVEKISTQIRKGEFFRTRAGETRASSWKKAIVQLHPDDKIELI